MITSYKNTGNGMQCMYIDHILNQDIKQPNPTILGTLEVFTIQLGAALRISVLMANKGTIGVT